jgi:hypothetical protein
VVLLLRNAYGRVLLFACERQWLCRGCIW